MNRTIRHVLVLTLATSVISALTLFIDLPADAVATRSFVLDDAASLAAGELDGTAVGSDGSVTAGAEVRRIALDDAEVAWSTARASDGTVYIGTGNDGKIYRLRGDDLSVFAETGQLLVSSLAVSGDGTLYAGTLPEGRIYKVTGNGQVDELVQPDDVSHVWDLKWDARRRVLFAATGPEGRVYSVDANGRAEIYWDSDAAHVMSLALDGEGNLYAGTSDDAVVVRLRGPGRAEVLYDFPGNEVTAIAERDGVVYAAANEFPDPPAARSSKTKSTTPARPRPGKGRLYRVGSDGRTERLYSNDDGHFASVQVDSEGNVFVGDGKEGRIYRVAPDFTSSTWIDVDERQILALDIVGDDPLFVTSDAAAVYRIVSNRSRNAVWTSKVLDAEFHARFGGLTWRGSGAVSFQTRSGNREEPDETWSEWSAPMSTAGPIRSPAGRFLQIRARLPEAGDTRLNAVVAYYLPQNQRARVHEVGIKAPAKSKNKNKSSARAGDDPPEPSSQYKLAWKVDNPDGDQLRYLLRYRAEGQSLWRDMLRPGIRLTDDEHTWDTSGIPDGYYIVQVEASDELANPATTRLASAAESEPLLIDNNPPRVEGLRTRGQTVGGRAIDGLGPIAKLEYAVDGGEWNRFFPTDDLLDNAEEAFEVDVGSLSSGEHIIAVRATDAGGNSATAETSLRTP